MALNASTGELMAVKQVEFPAEDHKAAQHDALRYLAFESETLRELDHPNIVQYLGCENSTTALSVFLEYVPGGTIATLLHKFGRFREEITKSFIKQILEGLDYLHANGIIHRDLKPDNILVEPTGICKISDFGISKRVEHIHTPRGHTLIKGTVHYMAPEVVGTKGKGYDGRIDIWSVGCMLMEMWTGEKPWGTADNVVSILLKLGNAQSPPPLPTQLQTGLSSDADNFRKSCFHLNPIQRPSAADLKQHPYLRLPPTWMFNEADISHPSKERKLRLGNQKKREQPNDGSTYRPTRHLAEPQDATIRQQDISNAAVSKTIRPPIARGPSPPIVIIQPIKPRSSSPPRPSSPVETQEQDKSTSGSSNTSRSRMSGKSKLKYHVANPQEQYIVPYQYVPPPLPSTSQAYSSRLGTSSEYSLDYIPDALPSSSSRTGSSPTPHIASTQNHSIPTSSSARDLTHSHSSSKLSGSSLPQSNGIEDSATWKRSSATASAQREGKLTSPSPKDERQRERGLKSPRSAYQLRPLPAPSAPLPSPSTTPPPTGLTLRASSSSASLPRSGLAHSTACHKHGNRPDAHDIVRDLSFYFPSHDLDQPVVTAASSVDELTEDSTSTLNGGGGREDNDANDRLTSRHTPLHSASGSPRGPLRPSSSHSLFKDYKYMTRLGPPNVVPTPSTYIPAENGNTKSDNKESNHRQRHAKSARISYTKSIRHIVEEREIKRRSHPRKLRRQTFWDSRMEELPAFSGSTRPPNPEENIQ
ncbi:hypothetical protein AGABI1DRAFT_103706 [Agaricus bisporus var. burnettii JB137-S8]|uniref:Protein kinase domain-containing protein n=1 Tax=Agaricus bisporus var. burnettii (strain JB137-S8 / ATCC MYA-4627 / FGSC 10392) TaxID=597362 RepID=K5X6L7_AGABU|nr:uncharacterized protein AGABI1DRAFT_103706 [Agaricus bisporus var. burnettii JB137-S8]EKM83531.1 hypothetical protein AGABI1DRAFT_103706 [Agaricus bisporus var. burnettii JB137-S8]